MNFIDMMRAQAQYNESKFGKLESNEEKRSISKDLALNSYNSINKMIEKMRVTNGLPNEDDLIYSSVDVLRYVMSILNLWEIKPEDVSKAFTLKDIYLDVENRIHEKKWAGEPVIIVDIDDVLCEFRSTFADFLSRRYDIKADVESDQYFFVEDILKASGNINPEKVFDDFVQERHFRCLTPVDDAVEFLTSLREKGYWIQLLTARPKENLKIFYDTYYWLDLSNIPFDRVDFSPEKLRWCMNSEYYDSGAIQFAIDDSPKHALEYANHGISVKVPKKSYNKTIRNDNVVFYQDLKDLIKTL